MFFWPYQFVQKECKLSYILFQTEGTYKPIRTPYKSTFIQNAKRFESEFDPSPGSKMTIKLNLLPALSAICS